MITAILTAITALLGIVGTIVAYRYSPQRRLDKINNELADIAQQEKKWEQERDVALNANNTDNLTIATDNLLQLRERKNVLLQQRAESH